MRFIEAFRSAAAAFFGVQNSKTYKHDFEHGTPFPFLLAGVILAVGLVLIVVGIVNLVI